MSKAMDVYSIGDASHVDESDDIRAMFSVLETALENK